MVSHLQKMSGKVKVEDLRWQGREGLVFDLKVKVRTLICLIVKLDLGF